MNLLESFFNKIKDKVNWGDVLEHPSFFTIRKNYNNSLTNMTSGIAGDLKNEMNTLTDGYKIYSNSTVDYIEELSKSSESLGDFLKEAELKIGTENTYLKMREVYEEYKKKIETSSEPTDDFEKSMLNTIQGHLTSLAVKIQNPEALWNNYKKAQEIINLKPSNYPSKPGGNGSVGGSGSGSTGDGYGENTTPYNPTQSDINWGQPSTNGSSKLLGMRRTNNSYSGTDMVATINIPGKGPIVFGELAQLSYSVFREKVPVRTLGRITPKGYTRGFRTITGVLVFTIFDKSIVYECMQELHKTGYKILMDEMPAFDVTITMSNEFGAKSKMTVYGISTYSEGQIMSIDALSLQNAYEFYAIDIDPITRLDDPNIFKGTSVIDSSGDIIRETIKDYDPLYYSEAYRNSIKQQQINTNNKFTFL